MDRPAHDADRPAETAETPRQRVEALEKSRGKDEGKVEASENIQPARPIVGEIDHALLTRKIIARFPKILAELAK